MLQRILARKPLNEIYFVKRTGEEDGDLAHTSPLGSLSGDLCANLLPNYFLEISYRHLTQIALQRDLAQQFLQS